MNEYWKLIKGGFKSKYGVYWVSSLGRFKNGSGKILSSHPHKKGYVLISMYREGKEGRYQAHRLVAKAFIPNPDQLPQVNHIDGNKKNNAVSNLQWCTNLQNMRHSWAIGLRQTSCLGRGVLSDDEVLAIRNEPLRKGPYASLTRKNIAEKYGVTEHVIKDVRSKRSYSHVS